MGYFKNIADSVSTLITGMKVTMGYFVRPREHVTLQYPDEQWPNPKRKIGVGELDSYNVIRSKLHVDIDDCIGCKKCERACPVDCITIDTLKADKGEDIGTTKNGTQKRLLVTRFTIDMTECMYCDLCTFPCPEDCIYMTPDYRFERGDNQKTEISTVDRWRNRQNLIYEYATVPPEEVERRKEAIEAEQAAKLAAAEKAKAAAEKKAAEAKPAEKENPDKPEPGEE
ncbi:MAG: 4Fe-4S dicluster domain-containing protein [Lentisphaeria bacterium]|nr:4Fe-4S dicluster domain-containing protein [Candidatus Neomarinimicrobiota bacterium]MCF7842228.1 4Fe-4S dicluster domain-containing protein [Lentisphaeria bacterium]